MTSAARHPLIEAAELALLLHDRMPVRGPLFPRVLDVRWRLAGPPGRSSYDAGHVPGAVFVDLDTDLSGPPGRAGRHPLPSAPALEAALRRAGVDAGRPVVVYDDADGTAAARAWWLLRHAGHDDVRLLDGGFAAWQAAGQPVVTEPTQVAEGSFAVSFGAMPTLDAAAAERLVRTGVLLDARAPERYRGDTEPVDPVAGHVPGAVSAPTTRNVAPEGRMRPPEELRSLFASIGVDGSRPVGVYCGSGVTAAHEVLALELAGISAALYVGSWSNWVAEGRQVAIGPRP
jgi:thiosulfate/3-mercaptopyruvate sulfurtransferase